MKNLLFFTWSYPYSAAAENTFIPQEISELATRFKKIIIIPRLQSGTKENICEPNVTVNTDYAEYLVSEFYKIKFLLKILLDKILFAEIGNNVLFFIKNPKSLKKAIHSRLISIITEEWIRNFFNTNKSSISDYIIETWWFDETTLGLANYTCKSGKTFTVTRAHGVDLYEQRHFPPYIPFRKIALNRIRFVFPDSLAGLNYLKEKYPGMEKKIRLGLIGVKDPKFNNRSSVDGIFRILSCSFLIPLKRIDLLILGLEQLRIICPERKFKWVHIGSGPEKSKLLDLSTKKLHANISFEFLDYPGKQELYNYYFANCVDLFINVSSTEGTPVAIMEAISCGIPIIATSVGGNTQIVDQENGVLLSENPDPIEIAKTIKDLSYSTDKLQSYRSGSKRKWIKCYNADRNYNDFADIILNSDTDQEIY